MVRVGIPQALLFYQYFPMWKTFFERLGAEVVISPATDRAMLVSGSARVVAETCLPVKVYCGHVAALAGKCDYIFVPAVRSIEENAYNCSKFLGLPDLVKAVVPECPPVLDVDIDTNKGRRTLYANIYRLGRRFTWDPLKVKEAAEAAWGAHVDYQALMRREALTPPQAMERMFSGKIQRESGSTPQSEPGITIAVIGHPYMIYDEYVNHRLLSRLRSMGARVLTPELVSEADLDRSVSNLVGRPYWTYEDEVVGAGGYYLENGSGVDGVISVVPFGCGPDSVMIDLLRREAKRISDKPFMSLAIDEHTAEAGLLTRLEAFLDMIARKKRLMMCA